MFKFIGNLRGKTPRDIKLTLEKQQEAREKNEMLRIANNLRAESKSHFEKILDENAYFKDTNRINMPECFYDKVNSLWRIAIEVEVPTNLDLERPKVIVSLNETADLYFQQLYIQLEEERLELRLMAESPNANLFDIQTAQAQLYRKYAILNHRLKFKSIEYLPGTNNHMVRIWLGFR